MDNINFSVISVIKIIFYPFLFYFLKTPNSGIQTQLHLCYMKNENVVNGGYYSDCVLTKLNYNATNREIMNSVIRYNWNQIIDNLKIRKLETLDNIPHTLKSHFEYRSSTK